MDLSQYQYLTAWPLLDDIIAGHINRMVLDESVFVFSGSDYSKSEV